MSNTSSFQPWTAKGACRDCEHYGGLAQPEIDLAYCLKFKQVQARPDLGCAFWVRATGLDVEPDQD